MWFWELFSGSIVACAAVCTSNGIASVVLQMWKGIIICKCGCINPRTKLQGLNTDQNNPVHRYSSFPCPVPLAPYVAEIWLHAIFQLINEDLCRICNECVLLETWSSFWTRWVLLRWLLSPLWLVSLVWQEEASVEMENKREEPNYKRILLKWYTERIQEIRKIKGACWGKIFLKCGTLYISTFTTKNWTWARKSKKIRR